jgi:hypothetical protein
MNSTIPSDLLELKTRFETWRTNRKYVREPIPNELWSAAADLSRRYPPSLVGQVLKIDPSRLKKFQLKRSARTSNRKKPKAAFFQLPTEIALPEVRSALPHAKDLRGERRIEDRDHTIPIQFVVSLDGPALNLFARAGAKLFNIDQEIHAFPP